MWVKFFFSFYVWVKFFFFFLPLSGLSFFFFPKNFLLSPLKSNGASLTKYGEFEIQFCWIIMGKYGFLFDIKIYTTSSW